jgi:hypothetical protein
MQRVGLFEVALLLLLLAPMLAQTPPTASPTPSVVDPANIQPVTLRVLNPDASVNSALIGQAVAVTVGGRAAEIRGPLTEAGLTIMPPAMDQGTHVVQLLDKAGGLLAQGQLRYEATSLGTGDGGDPANTRPTAQEVESEARQSEMARRDRLTESSLYYFTRDNTIAQHSMNWPRN